MIFGGAGEYRGLRGLGAFGAGGRTIFGPFTFSESWSSDDFGTDKHFVDWVQPYLSQVPNATGMSYSPPSLALINNCAGKWQAWNDAADSGNPQAVAYVAQFEATMKQNIKLADQLSLTTKGWPYVASREAAIEVQRYNVFNAIVKSMKQLSASAPPVAVIQPIVQPDPQTAASTYPAASNGGPSANSYNPGISQGASTMAVAPSSTPSWELPAIIGGAVLLLGGGAALLLMGKKSAPAALSGYRRSKRRARRSR